MTDHSDRFLHTGEQPASTFSAGARAQLGDALRNYLETSDPSRHLVLDDAMGRLCTEAHERQMLPEQMIVAVKEVWRTIPRVRRIDEARAGMAWDRVVSACLQAYFAGPAES